MNDIILYSVFSLSSIGVVAALILFLAAQKFKVNEDLRILHVEEVLPTVNCGGCGYPSCHAFAVALVKADDFAGLYCPVGGNKTMSEVAKILNREVIDQDPEVAVIRCSGSYSVRARKNIYDGASSCAIASILYEGDTGCSYGCLGLGDCVKACDFGALYLNIKTGLPEVIDDNCTACNACVTACPKNIIELRKKNKKDRKIFVSCINKDKGGITKKNCEVACIGCNKCVKVCPHDAITLKYFLAYIDPYKCKLCRKCVIECPADSIIEINFPPRKIKEEKKESA